jgi:toxin ParE1/3/4
MPEITRTDQAENDLIDLLTAVGRLNASAAARLRGDIDRAAVLLANSPGLGRSRPDLRPDLRSYPVARKYVIYFRQTDSGIEIARVVHGSRQVTPDMFDD